MLHNKQLTPYNNFRLPSPPLAKRGSLTHSQALALSKRARDVTALRCSEPLRYKVGRASKPSPWLCGMRPPGCYGDQLAIILLKVGAWRGLAGWDHQNCSPLQYRSALVVARMRNIIFILLLIGLPQERCPSGLWRKSYDRHWHLMNDHNDRGCHL